MFSSQNIVTYHILWFNPAGRDISTPLAKIVTLLSQLQIHFKYIRVNQILPNWVDNIIKPFFSLSRKISSIGGANFDQALICYSRLNWARRIVTDIFSSKILLLFLNSLALIFPTNMLPIHKFDVYMFVQVKTEALLALKPYYRLYRFPTNKQSESLKVQIWKKRNNPSKNLPIFRNLEVFQFMRESPT